MTDIARYVTATACALLIAGCSRPAFVDARVETTGMTGTVYVATSAAAELGTAAHVFKEAIERIHPSLDPLNPDSDVAKINGLGQGSRWPLAAEAFRLLDLANHYAKLTDSAYDMTAYQLYLLWGADRGTIEAIPDEEALEASLRGVGPDKVRIGDDRTISFASSLTRIDPARLLDGYIADTAVVQMRRFAITNCLLQLGIVTRASGTPDGRHPWSAVIPDPIAFSTNGLGVFTFDRSAALVCEGLRDRTIRVGETVEPAVLDPRTGYPAKGTALAAVTGPIATKAAALAHALLVVGVEGAPEMLGRFPDYEALLVPDGGEAVNEVWITRGFGERFVASNSSLVRHDLVAWTGDVRGDATTNAAAPSAAPAPLSDPSTAR